MSFDLVGPALLFCPGDRPDRFEKARDRSDTAILDLEDAVAPQRKEEAREAVRKALLSGAYDPARTIVRVNGLASEWGLDDLRAMSKTPLRVVMLPKVEHPLSRDEFYGLRIIALCETARGVANALRIADSRACVGLAWGGEDLSANLSATMLDPTTGQFNTAAEYVRIQMRLAAGAAGIAAIDTVRTDVEDARNLLYETQAAADLGFDAKLAIHPRQVPFIRQAFHPSSDDLEWARRVVASTQDQEGGVSLIDGKMVDAPVIARARSILGRASTS